MTERPAHGLLDTSVVIDLPRVDPEHLPVEAAISAVTLAELSAGPLATDDPVERAVRQLRLQRVEAAFSPSRLHSLSRLSRGRAAEVPGTLPHSSPGPFCCWR